MNSFRWTKNEEKELIALKNIYGMKRPSDISYQLNKIYGIERTPNQVKSRMRSMKHNMQRKRLTKDQLMEIWDFLKQYGLKWVLLEEKYKQEIIQLVKLISIHKDLIKEQLRTKCQSFLSKLNRVFGKENYARNQKKFRSLSLDIIKQTLQLYQDKKPPQDEQYLQVQDKAKQLVQLFDKMYKIQFDGHEDLFGKLRNYTNKQEIQSIFEFIFLLNRMKYIKENKDYSNSENKEEKYKYNMYQISNGERYLNFRYVKTWEEAENLILRPLDELNSNIKKETPLNLSLKEIKLIKKSVLYRKLFPDMQQKYVDLYNEAVINYQDNRDYTYLINETQKKSEVVKEIKVKQCERQKSNISIPLWKKNKNERTVKISPFSQMFLDEFLDGLGE